MNKLITITFLPIFIFLFTSCEKESNNPSKEINHVKVKMENVEPSGSFTGFSYKLTATIISPKRVDMTDHGFIIKIPSGETTVKLGSGSKIGSVSAEFFNPDIAFIDTSMVIFYVVLEESGDTLYSSNSGIPSNPTQNQTPSFSPDDSYTNINGFYDIEFYGIVNNPDPNRYVLEIYGIEYADSVLFQEIPYPNANLALVEPWLSGDLSQYSLMSTLIFNGNVTPGQNIQGRMFAEFTDNQNFQSIPITVYGKTQHVIVPNP